MAKGILGKSRAPRPVEAIPKPAVKASEIISKKDSPDADSGVSFSRPMNQGSQRPTTSEGRRIKKTEVASGFDFRITVPPAEVVRSSSGTDGTVNETMIGIALGSPRLVESANMMLQVQQMQQMQLPPIPNTEISPSLQRKPSKWRKIGGLFKAKNAISSPVNKPFYQVRTDSDWPIQGSSHSVDCKAQYQADYQSNPIEHTEVWPCLEPEAGPKRHDQERENINGRDSKTGPFLQVEIPKVELERYSVMFGGLLHKSQPSPLNRRSKTLDDVTIMEKEIPPPLSSPRRRATSPTRSKSPSFTLFPATPTSKASKILGAQNIPMGPPHPLRKQSLPFEPGQDGSSSNEKARVMLMFHNQEKGQLSHKTQESVSSFLSATSFGSEEASLCVHRVEPMRAYVDLKEPEWEIVNRKPTGTTITPSAAPVQKRDTREHSPDSTSDASTLSSPRSSTSAVHSKEIRGKTIAFPTMPVQIPPEEDPIPTIEVSVARSVSVSKGRRQILVPVRPRINRLTPSERLVARQAQKPRVTGAQPGHQHGNSQDVCIEII